MKQLIGKFELLLVALMLIGITQATPLIKENEFSFSWPGFITENKDYYVSNKEVSWFAANYYCYSKGWELVEPDDFDTIVLLKGFRELYDFTSNKYWSAGNQLASEKWVWGIDGKTFSYTNWAADQPNKNSSYNCLLLEQTADALWSNENCSAKHRFICQKYVATKKCETKLF